MAEFESEVLAIVLPADLARLVKEAVADGDYSSESEVVRAALRDWTARHRKRTEALAALKTDIEEGLADIEAGRTTGFDIDDIVAQGRRRLANG